MSRKGVGVSFQLHFRFQQNAHVPRVVLLFTAFYAFGYAKERKFMHIIQFIKEIKIIERMKIAFGD
ncbi:MAG: hypothetical protein KZQ70_14840 [gamma proteobacterium symbiont of Lucinoma myriamae]|nr:hypothetical protein [gamma proteobacterium symbiont of Lucinoma myriamae]